MEIPTPLIIYTDRSGYQGQVGATASGPWPRELFLNEMGIEENSTVYADYEMISDKATGECYPVAPPSMSRMTYHRAAIAPLEIFFPSKSIVNFQHLQV